MELLFFFACACPASVMVMLFVAVYCVIGCVIKQDRLCGGVEFPDKNLAYYPRLKDDLLEYAMQTIGSLESLDIYSLMDNLDFDILNLTGICMDHCPEPNEVVCTPEYLEVNPLPSLDYVAQCQGL